MIQYPKSPNQWLYQEDANGNREFTDFAILPDGTKSWQECTQAERDAWEEAHKPEHEPEAEVVE